MELKDRIKLRREELNMSQDDLASKLGYKSRSTIAKIEVGANDISQSKIKAFADALETTPAYLLGIDENKNQIELKTYQKITAKDERDIAKKLNAILNDLNEEALMFDGEVLDENTAELLRQSLENSLRLGKTLAKQKFTPKKYK